MCVRLSPSHPAARIVVGLYIFLVTFLFGYFVAKAIPFLETYLLSPPSISDEVRSPVKSETDPYGPRPCDLLLSKTYQHMAKFKSINIVNDGNKTIYLEVNSKSKVFSIPIGDTHTFELGDVLWAREIELQPGWAYITHSPLKNVDEAFSIIVKYREGNTGNRQMVTARFGADDDTPRSCVATRLGDRP